jgi:signal transduction histidine kinase
MDRLTLRARAALLGTAATAIVLAVASVVLVLTLESQLTRAGDGLARARVRDLLGAVERGGLPVDGRIDNLNDDSMAQVVAADDTVLAATPNVAGRPAIVTAGAVSTGGDLAVVTLEAPDDDETERYRVWVGGRSTADGPVTVLVGTSLESVSEASATLRRSLLLGVPLVLVVLGLAIWTVLGAALRRVDRITTTVGRIDEADLWRRVEETEVDDEVGRLARTMNLMLERLERGAQKQRAFVADASHDLQSPLTAMRADLEVALAHPERVEMPALARDLLAASGRMEEVVADLLHLAVEDDAPLPEPMLLDLDAVVLEEVARAWLTGRRLTIDTSGVSAAPVRGDAAALRRCVRNLLDNAVRYAGARVVVTLAATAAEVALDIRDDGPGISPEDHERVFDRFYRGDPARTASAGNGSGLGLAIARRVAERHGGSLTVEDGPALDGRGARLRLVLPGA